MATSQTDSLGSFTGPVKFAAKLAVSGLVVAVGVRLQAGCGRGIAMLYAAAVARPPT